MLGVLLESRARRQRRAGGAALSVALHLAIVAFITMTTVRIAPARPNRDRPTPVRFTVPKTVSPPVARVVTDQRTSGPVFQMSRVPTIDVPRVVPTSLPAIDFNGGTTPAEIVIGPSGNSGGVGPRGILDGERGSSTEWRGSELLMRIVTTAKPKYPDYLRQAGLEGTVVVRFTVDTTGRVDRKSAQIISSTHDLFSRAVLEALDGFRFKPAEVGTRRVAALAEMPFEFRISK
ncbi:MAG TPA: TonB family protein [Gemmatimonadaceae bacterium]|nr:TonB family protein [Gemmatimonadaceae bacterium]